MPGWSEVLAEIQLEGAVGPVDVVRRRYMARLFKKTGRNVIAYYSGWLSQPAASPLQVSISDQDKNAFMAAIKDLDRPLGLDLILHTPGGDIAATESLVHYLRKMFGSNIRAIVPQLAMSAGTMLACASRSIVMGKQSNLGPIDPQLNGIPATGVLEEFKKALVQIKGDPAAIPLWQSIIGKYHPTFLGACENAVTWSKSVVTQWLCDGMFADDDERHAKASKIAGELSDSATTLAHARHIHIEALEQMGLVIEPLEKDHELQDLVLTVHHAFMHTFSMSPAVKIVENHMGVATVHLVSPRSPPPG